MGDALVLLATLTGNPGLEGLPLATGQGAQIPILRITLVLIICLGLAVGLAVWMKRSGSRRLLDLTNFSGVLGNSASAPGDLVIKEQKRINETAEACVIEAKGKSFLVVVTPHVVEVLDESATDALPGDEAPSDFAQELRQ